MVEPPVTEPEADPEAAEEELCALANAAKADATKAMTERESMLKLHR